MNKKSQNMMKSRLLYWYEGLRNSSRTTNTLVKEITKTRNLQTPSPNLVNEMGKGKARELGRLPMKGNLNKTDIRKTMIVAWGIRK